MKIKKFNDFNNLNEGYVNKELSAEIKAAKTVEEVKELVAQNNVSKGDLMKIAFNDNTNGVDSAIPMGYWDKMETRWFVMDYQTNSWGKLVHLAEKIVGEETNWEQKFMD